MNVLYIGEYVPPNIDVGFLQNLVADSKSSEIYIIDFYNIISPELHLQLSLESDEKDVFILKPIGFKDLFAALLDIFSSHSPSGTFIFYYFPCSLLDLIDDSIGCTFLLNYILDSSFKHSLDLYIVSEDIVEKNVVSDPDSLYIAYRNLKDLFHKIYVRYFTHSGVEVKELLSNT